MGTVMLCPDHVMGMLCAVTMGGWIFRDGLPIGLTLVDRQEALASAGKLVAYLLAEPPARPSQTLLKYHPGLMFGIPNSSKGSSGFMKSKVQ